MMGAYKCSRILEGKVGRTSTSFGGGIKDVVCWAGNALS